MSIPTLTQDTLFARVDSQAPDAVEQAQQTQRARAADRELCLRYFRAWCGTVGSLNGTASGHPVITFEQFQAAADRLAD